MEINRATRERYLYTQSSTLGVFRCEYFVRFKLMYYGRIDYITYVRENILRSRLWYLTRNVSSENVVSTYYLQRLVFDAIYSLNTRVSRIRRRVHSFPSHLAYINIRAQGWITFTYDYVYCWNARIMTCVCVRVEPFIITRVFWKKSQYNIL